VKNKEINTLQNGFLMCGFLTILILIPMSIYYFVHLADKPTKKPTSLVVKNSTSDTVLVYLTLGIKKGFQGTFFLMPNDSVSYTDYKSIPIQGNITFWEAPQNCVNVNLFEFCLNNKGTVKNAQETVDISCMGGVNVIGSITLQGGGKWTDNYKNHNVTRIQNNKMYQNNDISGVYPLGCPYCVTHIDKPRCVTKPSEPNKHNICQVQRNADQSGGTVTVTYLGLSK
jgi:hypothetical protein